MGMKELVESVSGRTGVSQDSVKKVLSATFTEVSRQIEGEDPVKLPGLGTFRRKAGKEEGTSRVVFRPWPSKEQMKARKQKRQAKKEGKKAQVES